MVVACRVPDDTLAVVLSDDRLAVESPRAKQNAGKEHVDAEKEKHRHWDRKV